jgi:hypothetical protein
MGGGLMQLVAYGAQDVYLTGNPQITFFKVVYRRHTNFAMEHIQQTINGSSEITANETNGTVTISRNGDLVGRAYVQCATDAVDGISGDQILSTVDIEIGGQRIDRLTKEYNQIMAELTTPESKAAAYKYLTGGQKNTLVASNTAALGGTSQQKHIIPLQFWFNRNPGLALPLIALQYHEVKLKLTWGKLSDCARDNGTLTTSPIGGLEVWCEYIYLDTDERRRFAQVSHEYLIEQVQIQGGATNSSIKLNFNHPVKEIIWTDENATTTQTARLILNGQDRFADQSREYFQIYQPLEHHTAVPGFNIKETDRPQLLTEPIQHHTNAAQSTNQAAIVSAPIGIDIGGGDHAHISLYSTTIVPKIGDIIIINQTRGSASNVTHSGNYTVCVKNVAVHAVGTTYKITLTENILAPGFNSSANDEITLTIIARTQDPQSRCSQLATNVNCYSFALKPEEHQPSGTCNFSRIDNAQLKFSSSVTVGNIYAINYNVLRVMSGMGGLAYSN